MKVITTEGLRTPRSVTLDEETWNTLLEIAQMLGTRSRSQAITYLARQHRKAAKEQKK